MQAYSAASIRNKVRLHGREERGHNEHGSEGLQSYRQHKSHGWGCHHPQGRQGYPLGQRGIGCKTLMGIVQSCIEILTHAKRVLDICPLELLISLLSSELEYRPRKPSQSLFIYLTLKFSCMQKSAKALNRRKN